MRILRRRKEWGEFAGILRGRNSLCEFEVFCSVFSLGSFGGKERSSWKS